MLILKFINFCCPIVYFFFFFFSENASGETDEEKRQTLTTERLICGLWLNWIKEDSWEASLMLANALQYSLESRDADDYLSNDPQRRLWLHAAQKSTDDTIHMLSREETAFLPPSLTGKDVIRLGITPGPKIGIALAAIKAVEVSQAMAVGVGHNCEQHLHTMALNWLSNKVDVFNCLEV